MKLPHNTDMEQRVIHAAIFQNELISNLRAIVTPEDMYLDFNRKAYEIVLKCYDKYGAADETFIDEFQKNGIGDGETLKIRAIIDAPTSAAPVREALVLRKHAAKRRLILAISKANDIASTGNANKAQKIMQRAIEKYNKDILGESDNIPASKTAEELIDWFETAVEDPNSIKGMPTGFTDIDNKTNGWHNQNVIVIAARPGVGKSAFAGQVAEAAANQGYPVGIISLEMSAVELVKRSASRLSGVLHDKIRDADVEIKSDREKIFDAFIKYGNMPIIINDKGGLSRHEIYTVAMDLHKNHAIKLLIVDYLQLIRVEKETRYEAITNASVMMKTIAKRLNIPVIALSQLNRQVEGRKSNRPCMADLRECLSLKSTNLFDIHGVQCNNNSRMYTYGLNKDGKVAPMMSSNVPKKSAETITVRLRSGRYVRCTKRHLILTDVGWIEAANLTRDHAIASIRKIEEPPKTERIEHARWIGWMLGNGSMTGYGSPSFICSCERLAQEFILETRRLFCVEPKPHAHKCKSVYQYDITNSTVRTPEGNPVRNWLKSHDLWGPTAKDKKIPDWFLEKACNESIAELVGGMIDTDGSVYEISGRPTISFATTSEKMMWQFIYCMNRLGLFWRIDEGRKNQKATTPCYKAIIQDNLIQCDFIRKVKLIGRKGDRLKKISYNLNSRNNHGDRLGTWVSDWIKDMMDTYKISISDLGYRPQGKRISQNDLWWVLYRMEKIAPKSKKDTAKIRKTINENIYWDRLKRIDSHGVERVFDREVPGDNNFIANGIVVHNSGAIEQDSDLIGFLYRDDKEPNIINLDFQKHRHGETFAVKFFFRGECLKFMPLDNYRCSMVGGEA